MAGKRKKKSTKSNQQQLGGYKRFLTELNEFINLVDFHPKLSNIPTDLRRVMYRSNVTLRNPVAVNHLVSPQELKYIDQKARAYNYEKNIDVRGIKVSTHQLKLAYCHGLIKVDLAKKVYPDTKHPKVLMLKEMTDSFIGTVYGKYILNYFKIITQISCPSHKYYSANVRIAKLIKDNPKLEIAVEINAIPARKYLLKINKIKRPVYKLAKAMAENSIEWIKVKTSLLGHHYNGSLQEIEAYIQAHALQRLNERLDLLDKASINYTIWENTHNIEHFFLGEQYVLLPYKVFDIKVGYFLANVIDDKLIIRTFLFITHNSTPEGELLKQKTGLGKHDISYWKIDRLSTFINLDEDKHGMLQTLFDEIGIQDLFTLKNKDLNVDDMQAANLSGLVNYLDQGKNSSNVQTEELNTFLAATN